MSMQPEQIASLIESGIPGATATVGGDGTHFSAVVVSAEFAGKPVVQQHQIVYRALGGRMGTEIHALSIQTYTPEQWQNRRQPGAG
jgi:acid stress-induced BolA-like protein IbaG/YrbA